MYFMSIFIISIVSIQENNFVSILGKILVKSNGKNIIRMQMKSPCEHIFLRSIFEAAYNMSNCLCPKGRFINDFNIETISRKYYDGSFLYGNITFQTTLHSDVCNFSCTIIDGKFDLRVTKFETCKGPKAKNCSELKTEILNRTTVHIDVVIKETTKLSKGKILVKANGKNIIRMQMKNPCEHIFLRPIFMAAYNMSKNCLCPKGRFINNFNIEGICKKYYDGSFLYGNITIQTILHSDVCNFSCSIVEVEMYPKK
ncbi:hypothetical protein ABMA27_002178 [Loxostege sticticalis]|uniref:Uncharacterized protein n=1 Tax=Loxostege sticticalis TaxID=481309 RepID=A0ABR3HX35_LOXSC